MANSSLMNDRPFAAPSLHSQPTEVYLRRPKQWLPWRPKDVATSFSPSGWLGVATSKDVRLYMVTEINPTESIPVSDTLSIGLHSTEKIRVIALSESLLVVVTDRRLRVYDLMGGPPIDNLVEDRSLGYERGWIPHAVSIVQIGTAAEGAIASATIAVGGIHEDGVKLFRYTYRNCWNGQTTYLVLECPRNNGAVKHIGFSPSRLNFRGDQMAFALTTGNQLYCWLVDWHTVETVPSVRPCWQVNCNPPNNPQSFSDEISSASLVISPGGKRYIFCTVNHRPASYLPLSFTVYVDNCNSNHIRPYSRVTALPEDIIGPYVVGGVTSASGHFAVIVECKDEKSIVKVLKLHDTAQNVLTCTQQGLMWEARLSTRNARVSATSILIREDENALQIIVVDKQGHIVFASVSVPGMRACT